MRILVTVSVPVEQGNSAIKNGEIAVIIGSFVEQRKPEASYFYGDPSTGKRTAMFVIEVQDSSEIPSIAEPFFMGLNAAVQLIPVMNAEELNRGLAQWAGSR